MIRGAGTESQEGGGVRRGPREEAAREGDPGRRRHVVELGRR